MSLLITSNTALSSEGDTSIGLNTPSSYVNNLNGTLRIPANSEIAVQSVKLSKTGNISIPEGGLKFGFYFGRGFNYDTTDDYLNQTSFMTTASGGEGGESISVGQLAEASAIGLNRNLWHPNLLENASSGRNPGASCIVQRNASLDLVGFKFNVTNSASTKNESNLPSTWRVADFSGGGFNKIGNELSADATNGIPINVIGESFPLSLAGGEFNCSLGNSSKSEWSVGLSRCLRADFDYQPSYFSSGTGDDFFDYVVKQVEEGASHVIRLYHCISAVQGSGHLGTEMEEINYGTVIDGISASISNVTWKVNGEQVVCKVIRGDGTVLTLCDGLSATSASNAKPINMMCRSLYPKVTLESGKNVTITGFNGVKVKDFIYGDVAVGGTIDAGPYLYKDYWAHLENTDQVMDIGFDFELRNAHNGFPTQTGGFDGQIGITAGGLINYPTNGILLGFAPYKGTDNAGLGTGFQYSGVLNSAKVYGFYERNIVPTSTLVNPLSWISSEAPIIKNTNSLFVRLKNMTFDSANFSTSNMSKILYHIPAFSNNGESTGSLFFEASPMVYLKLNNSYEINMTTIEVDIVNSNETISQDLLGKSVVVFHIRDSK